MPKQKEINWKYEIGQRLTDYNNDGSIKRDLIIIDRIYIKGKGDYYKYYCNICTFNCEKHYKNQIHNEEYLISGDSLIRGNGCACCSGKIVVGGINDIPTTAPWMVQYFQGGYEEAKKYTKSSNQKIHPICPDCRNIKDKSMIVSTIYSNHSIACSCSDKKSYISKYMFNLLKQLNLDFKTEERYDWCKFFNIFKKVESFGIYDFVLENHKLIIETDGGWHKKNNTKSGQTKEESIFLDNQKDKLANEHGYKMIRISDDGNVKQNILNSDFNILFDLSKIDWLKCEEFAYCNLVKIACDYWNNNSNLTTSDLGKIMGYDYATIRKWLKQGNKLEWCIYDVNKELDKNAKKIKEKICKTIKCIDDNRIFNSIVEASKYYKISATSISLVCGGKRKTAKGMVFAYEV